MPFPHGKGERTPADVDDAFEPHHDEHFTMALRGRVHGDRGDTMGLVAIEFITPGYLFFHSHKPVHIEDGMIMLAEIAEVSA